VKLLVRNLARFTTEKQLLGLFESHGKVQFCTLVKDKKTGKSKGFGFVEMPKPGEAKAAMIAINGIDIDGNRVRVKKAEVRPDDNADKPTHKKTRLENFDDPDAPQSTEKNPTAPLPAPLEETVTEKTPIKDRAKASDKTPAKSARSKWPEPADEKEEELETPNKSIWPQD